MSRTRRTLVTAGLLLIPLLAACGTREPHSAVIAALNGGAATTGGSSGGLIGGGLTGSASGDQTSGAGTTDPAATSSAADPTATEGTTAGSGGGTTSGTTAPSGTTSVGGTGATTPKGVTATAAATTGGKTTTGGTKTTTGGAKTTGSTKTTATSTAAASAAPAAGKQDTTPIVICQVGSFSGIAGPPLAGAQGALQAWVQYTNAHGGVAGHAIKLDSKDDQGNGSNTLSIVQNCFQNEHAVAIVAPYLPVSLSSVQSYIDQNNIPVVGGDGLEAAFYSDKLFFPQGTSTQGLTDGLVASIKSAGFSTAATVYCSDTSSCSLSANQFTTEAKAQGVAVKDSFTVSTANQSFSSQCSQMQSDKIQAVYPALDGASIQRLAKDCNGIGYKPLYVTGGLALEASTAASDPNLDGIQISTTVFPWTVNSNPAEAAFASAMSTYAPDVDLGESAAQGWTAGQEFLKAVTNLGNAAVTAPVTSAMVLQGLQMVKNERLGGLVMGSLNFNAGAPVTQDLCWGTVVLNGGTWTAPKGDAYQCAT